MKSVFITLVYLVLFTQNIFAGEKVLILGAGIGGMTAADELARRGFEVTVIESGSVTGGKARSVEVPHTGTGGRQDLPGEHGFRIFPSSYFHFYDTLSKIPGPDGNPAVNQLYLPEVAWFERDGGREPLKLPTGGEYSGGYKELLQFAYAMSQWTGPDLPYSESLFFMKKITYLLTSSPERRMAELENISWWDYLEANSHSDTYKKIFALGTARTLLAMKPTVASARIVGEMFIQLFLAATSKKGGVDRMLMGPSNIALFNPWQEYLEKNFRTQFNFNTEVLAFNMKQGKIESIKVRGPEGLQTLKADHYISALPLDVMQKLVTKDMLTEDPDLSHLSQLYLDTMVGLQFYMSEKISLPTSHGFLLDSPWAIAVVYNQTQVWQNYSLKNVGDGKTKSIISITFGDVDAPGTLNGKSLSQSSEKEIIEETIAQLDRHLGPSQGGFVKKNLLTYNFDPAVRFDKKKTWSTEPLFINSVGSYHLRPKAQTQIPNLVLGADYVLTDFETSSTMEAANAAGRNAAIAVLKNSQWKGDFPKVFKLTEPVAFAGMKALDKINFKLGLPHPMAYVLGKPPKAEDKDCFNHLKSLR